MDPAMLRLRTFGGLSLSRGDENLTGAITQRRRLAILALLAAAGEPGVSRDKLLAYLWPESDGDHARHVLNQLLYAQRRQVGESLFLGRKTLRLNPSLIWTDVRAFDVALEAGELETAVALYAGAFLDGFFVRGAGDFERWVEAQRAQFVRRVTAALAALAERATAAGDHVRAAEWWRRATEADPFDSVRALAQVRALSAGGDRAGALLAARRHEELLARELGVPPNPTFAAEVARLL
jgi:DNA-binding SARP family transcriptional activator